MAKPWKPLLGISDGDETILLVGNQAGYQLVEWKPTRLQSKEGGIWQSSPFTDGRQLVMRNFDNIIDSFSLHINNSDIDALIYDTQKLGRLLEKAIAYWTTSYQANPVYLFARGAEETNIRYATIMDYKTPNDDDPFKNPTYGRNKLAMSDLVLTIEHEPWRALPPGQSECVPISNYSEWEFPTCFEFDGADSYINLQSPAKEDNLADAAFTAEAWVYAYGWGENNEGRIFDKTAAGNAGWWFGIDSAGGLRGFVNCGAGAGTDADSTSGLDEFTLNAWHHVAMTWDDAADRKVYLWIDGVQVASYAAQVAGVGAIDVDAALDLYIGNRINGAAYDRTWDGKIGWTRISNIVRYAAPFTPIPRTQIPDTDANTVWLGLTEGAGVTINDYSNMAVVTDGSLWPENGTWCGESTPPVPFCYFNFNGDGYIDLSDPAGRQNILVGGQATVECWFCQANYFTVSYHGLTGKYLAHTNGWEFRLQSTGNINAFIRTLAGNIASVNGAIAFDGLWHHAAFTWDDLAVPPLVPIIWYDGAQLAPLGTISSATTATNDVGVTGYIGDVSAPPYWPSRTKIGWVRWSNTLRYAAPFTPPSRCVLPAPDINTVWLGLCECSGTTIVDYSPVATNGILTPGTGNFGTDC